RLDGLERSDGPDDAALAAALAALGATVLRPRGEAAAGMAWPEPLAAAVEAARHRHGRAYVLGVTRGSASWRLAGGLPDTPADSADPWSLALLAAAARAAGADPRVEPAPTGGSVDDDLQGFDLQRPSGGAADAVLLALVGALSDGLRIAQLKC
ncbi:MAG: hypothetical protein ACK52I_20450, partial [Pseudomonadota bacterium]